MLIKKKSYFVLFYLLCSVFCFAQTESAAGRVSDLISKSEEKQYNQAQKRQFLLEALQYAEDEPMDSIRNKLIHKISYAFFKRKDSANFRKVNKRGIDLSQQIKDSLTLSNHYWDLASFYSLNKINDSAFYFFTSAKRILEKKKPNHRNVARLALIIADIQKNVKDYTGSERRTIEATEIFNMLDDYENLYACYNNLGIIYNNLEEFDEAIKYHNEALDNLKKLTKYDKIKEAMSLNNIGIVYSNMENYEKAIDNYRKALNYDSIYNKRPKLYAILLDNLAYAKFKLNDFENLPDLFYNALDIREDLNISEGIVVNKLHLSEYYLHQQDTLKSLEVAQEAKNLAQEVSSNDHLLDIYKLLARIEPEKDSEYLNAHIALNDSLVKQERSVRNKYTRIQYETDEYITQNKKLNVRNNWIVAISTTLIFIGFLIYIITRQRTRNKELEMEQQQQRANEEIYNLMIDQQDKFEEGRKKEKERISLELHDGILGRLFGTRLSLGSLNTKDDDSSKKVRQQYIDELQSIEEEVRNISHELGLDNFDTTRSYSTMIDNLLEEQSKITNFKYQIEDDDRIVWTDIPGHIKINIFRIIQESIQNINKYAKAENVILDFKERNGHIKLIIKDDGVGFNQDKKSSGIGLKNMKSRVSQLHGEFTITSAPGEGTTVIVDVPMTENLTKINI